jgi:transcriptional regulator GlxA family with amidase domain
MPAMTNVLVKDDAAAPIEWTLLPVSDTPIPNWRSNAAALSLAGQLRLWQSIEQMKSGDWKITVKLEVPVMETLGASGAATGYVAPQQVAYVTTGILTMFASPRSTIADRANTLKLLIGIAQGATSVTATGTLANTAAGDAWKNSAAFTPQLFVNLVVPN